MYHDFSHGRKFKTLSGKEVSVEFKNGDIRINDARLLSRDRQARNGVVHSVDSVVEAS
jgi:uncharacterized surface protein with fasciclin (FAS1) repeats